VTTTIAVPGTSFFENPGGRLEPVEVRHAQVHQDDIGPKLDREVRRRLPVLGACDHAIESSDSSRPSKAVTKRPLSSAMSTVRGLELITS
jgi:hypothetical protein